MKFNPYAPTCPECGARLTRVLFTIRYPKSKGKMRNYVCLCGVMTAVFTYDNPTKNVGYTMRTVNLNDD